MKGGPTMGTLTVEKKGLESISDLFPELTLVKKEVPAKKAPVIAHKVTQMPGGKKKKREKKEKDHSDEKIIYGDFSDVRDHFLSIEEEAPRQVKKPKLVRVEPRPESKKEMVVIAEEKKIPKPVVQSQADPIKASAESPKLEPPKPKSAKQEKADETDAQKADCLAQIEQMARKKTATRPLLESIQAKGKWLQFVLRKKQEGNIF